MQGTILQVSVSRGGVPKRSIPQGDLGPLGIAGDHQAHPQFHGGPRQAVLLIAYEAIAELIAMGFPLYPGALGENITTQGVDHKQWRAGQRWRVGQAIIEFTKLREPCRQLNVYGTGIQKSMYDAKAKAGDPSSPKWAMGGFYATVVRPGVVRSGDPVMLMDQMA
jgi:MOSC domain-containing protein YiiM